MKSTENGDFAGYLKFDFRQSNFNGRLYLRFSIKEQKLHFIKGDTKLNDSSKK